MNEVTMQKNESPSMGVIKNGKSKAKGKSKEKPKTIKKSKAVASTVAKVSTKKKTVAKGKKQNVVIDFIEETVHDIENLTKPEAFSMVDTLLDSVDYSYFRLGGVLSSIQENAWYSEDGYESFKLYVNEVLPIDYRKARYLMAIYDNLVNSGVSWDSVKALSWTKLKELAAILTPENVDKWVAKALEMSTLQLQSYIKNHLAGENPDGSPTSESEHKISTMTFKVHEDQREVIRESLDKAKSELPTEFDTVALESICLDHLSGPGKKDKPVKMTKALLSKVMKAIGWEETLDVFGKVYPDIDLQVVADVDEIESDATTEDVTTDNGSLLEEA